MKIYHIEENKSIINDTRYLPLPKPIPGKIDWWRALFTNFKKTAPDDSLELCEFIKKTFKADVVTRDIFYVGLLFENEQEKMMFILRYT
jgi:hypothetical protein